MFRTILAFFLMITIFGIALADTNVGGVISTNTTWTLAGSPYIVTSSVDVAGSSAPILTIEPGVTIKFNAGKYLGIGINTVGSSPGRLQAVGTVSAPIKFEANTASPTPGFWAGIRLYYTTTAPTSLIYVQIRHATDGLQFWPPVLPVIHHASFENNSVSGFYNNTVYSPAVYQSSFIGNAAGIKGGGTTIASYCWWNSATGPSGSGPGTGQSVTSSVKYEPWLVNLPSDNHYFQSFSQTDRTFVPSIGIYTTLNFATAVSGNWTVNIYNSSSVLQKTFTGTGAVASIIWNGQNEAGQLQPAGTYTYQLDSLNSPDSATAAKGRLVVNATGSYTITSSSTLNSYFSPNADTIQDKTTIFASTAYDGTTWTLTFKNSGGTVVRTATVLGASLGYGYGWYGQDNSGVTQPDGIYRVDILATNDSATASTTINNLVLDTIFPSASVTSPSQTEFLSNVYEDGVIDMPIIGTADDLNFSNWKTHYGAGYAPTSWTEFAAGTTKQINTTISTWPTEALNNGEYTLRLQVWDLAGNRTDTLVNVLLGNAKVVQFVNQLNSAASGTISYQSSIPFALTQTLVIKNSGGSVVRTLLNNTPRSTGTYNTVWDGKDAQSQFLPDGVYSVISTFYSGPYTLVWDKSNSDLSTSFSCDGSVFSSVAFDPFNNVSRILTYSLSLPHRVQIYFQSCSFYPNNAYCSIGSCPNRVTLVDELQASGPHTIRWLAVDNQGLFKQDLIYGKLRWRRDMFPKNAAVLFGTKPVISNLQINPPFYTPQGGIQSVNFNLATFQSQSVNVSIEFMNQGSLSVLKTITGTAVPSAVSFQWDGTADNGMPVAADSYTITVTVTDSLGNQVKEKALATIRY